MVQTVHWWRPITPVNMPPAATAVSRGGRKPIRSARRSKHQAVPGGGREMKKAVTVFAASLLALAVIAPVSAQQQPPKGSEGPIMKVEPKGTEGPDVRKKATKKKAAAKSGAMKPRIEPKDTGGPGIRKVEPKGTAGPDVRKEQKK